MFRIRIRNIGTGTCLDAGALETSDKCWIIKKIITKQFLTTGAGVPTYGARYLYDLFSIQFE